MGSIVVCGEALMDVFALADTVTGMALETRLGGSPLNVAVGLAWLGRPVAFHGAISTDFLVDRLVRALRSEGVDVAPVVRVDAPTTLTLVGLDAAGVPSYSFYGKGERPSVARCRLTAPRQGCAAMSPRVRRIDAGGLAAEAAGAWFKRRPFWVTPASAIHPLASDGISPRKEARSMHAGAVRLHRLRRAAAEARPGRAA